MLHDEQPNTNVMIMILAIPELEASLSRLLNVKDSTY